MFNPYNHPSTEVFFSPFYRGQGLCPSSPSHGTVVSHRVLHRLPASECPEVIVKPGLTIGVKTKNTTHTQPVCPRIWSSSPGWNASSQNVINEHAQKIPINWEKPKAVFWGTHFLPQRLWGQQRWSKNPAQDLWTLYTFIVLGLNILQPNILEGALSRRCAGL